MGKKNEAAGSKKKWTGPRADNPPNRGSKPRPSAAPNCFKGMQFVITGILDSLLREECVDMIKELGGKVVSAPSKKVTHGIVGTDPGESKLKKLRALKIPCVDEDWLFDIMRKSAPHAKTENMDNASKNEPMVVEKVGDASSTGVNGASSSSKPHNVGTGKVGTQLWVDKYSPTELGDLVGNLKNVKDLRSWLSSWKSKFLRGDGHQLKLKDRKDSDFAAALLSGPPGVGKTSAAHAVCRAEGFEALEFNASDVRNKGGITALAESVMVTSSIVKFLSLKSKRSKNPYPNGQVLIMDEVDGMSGGDRGGSTELIKMIKTSKVPIICICNDDSSQKIRTLSGHCMKLKFRRPTAIQVRKRILDIARREGYRHIDDNTIDNLRDTCNGDMRQMINLLQTWRLQSADLNYGDVRNRMKGEGKTVSTKSIFDLAFSFFKPGLPGSVNSFANRIENYFVDADLVPLFVQENYITSDSSKNSLEALADAAESISEGDLCSNLIRGQQRWELMPCHAVLSSVRPGSTASGSLGSFPMFPSFFGSLSKGNKFKRIVQELEMKVKAGGTTSGSVRAFRLDYIPALTTCLATPLISSGAAGVDDVIERLDAYYLEKDPDWSDILECGVYAKGRSPTDCIPSVVKTTLTRTYKTKAHRKSSVTGVRFGVANRRATAGADISKLAKTAGESGVVDEDPESGDEDEIKTKDDDMSEFAVKKKGKAKSSKSTKKRPSSAGRGSARKRTKRS